MQIFKGKWTKTIATMTEEFECESCGCDDEGCCGGGCTEDSLEYEDEDEDYEEEDFSVDLPDDLLTYKVTATSPLMTFGNYTVSPSGDLSTTSGSGIVYGGAGSTSGSISGGGGAVKGFSYGAGSTFVTVPTYSTCEPCEHCGVLIYGEAAKIKHEGWHINQDSYKTSINALLVALEDMLDQEEPSDGPDDIDDDIGF